MAWTKQTPMPDLTVIYGQVQNAVREQESCAVAPAQEVVCGREARIAHWVQLVARYGGYIAPLVGGFIWGQWA